MRGWVRFLPVVVVALVIGALVWRLANPPTTDVRSGLLMQPAPNFVAVPAIAGKAGLNARDLADGKPKLLNFFASWCVPCIGEAPVLSELAKGGVPIVGIAVRDRPDDVRRFLSEYGDPFQRIGMDPQSRVQLAFGSSGVPETFVVDGRGIIRMQHIGPLEPDDIPTILQAMEQAR